MAKKKLLEAGLALPLDDRAELVREIVASLDGPPDEGAEDAWAAEIRRRVRQLEHGGVKTVAWSETERRIKQRVRRMVSR